MADLRNDLAKALDDWFESKSGKEASWGATMGLSGYLEQYLRNRLRRAFVAGWEARERTEQQRAPSKSQAKRIAAMKGEKL